MAPKKFYQYQVRLIKDEDTGQIVAQIPALDIADYGPDSPKALQRMKRMVAFHIECLEAEGKPIPQEKRSGEGLYLRVKRPDSGN